LFARCKILSSSRGLCIQLRDEGSISNVTFRDIQFVSRYHSDPWWGRGEAISFTAIPRTATTRIGTLQNVLVENVSGRAENSIRVNGMPQSRIADVRFKNVSVKFARWTRYAGGVYDNRPTKVLTPIETHALDGFNLRFADRVTLENCSVNLEESLAADFKNAVAAEDSTDLQIRKFRGESATPPILRR